MSFMWVNWETCSKRLRPFSHPCFCSGGSTSVCTRALMLFSFFKWGAKKKEQTEIFHGLFVICFLIRPAAKKKTPHTPSHHDLTKKKQISLPHMGLPRMLMPGVCKPDHISKRELSQIREKAMVVFALPRDMWPPVKAQALPADQAAALCCPQTGWRPGSVLGQRSTRHLLQTLLEQQGREQLDGPL